MCAWYLCVCRGLKYFKVVSDWLILDADLYGTILSQQEKEQPREHPEEEPKQTKSINLPYIQRLSEQLKRALNKHNIKARFYTQTTLRSLLSKPKEPISKEERNNAVYQRNCKDCEAVYMGETKRTLNIRAEEHITAIKSASKKSHTAEHCWKYNHDFDWEYMKVLDVEKKLENKTHQRVNLLRRKRASYQWNILQIAKYLETSTTRKQSKENNRQNYNIIKLSPQRSANKYGSMQVSIQNQPIRNGLKIFRSSANT